ncbi:MAG TPA: hypothetical protein VFA04_01250 [Bryobacteraceae bacterium]|nr:hypothetical protein [Bryobacteraceae bacterium]
MRPPVLILRAENDSHPLLAWCGAVVAIAILACVWALDAAVTYRARRLYAIAQTDLASVAIAQKLKPVEPTTGLEPRPSSNTAPSTDAPPATQASREEYLPLPPDELLLPPGPEGASAKLTLDNRTHSRVTIQLSGPVAQTVNLGQNASQTLDIPSGDYELVARASGDEVRFAGARRYAATARYRQLILDPVPLNEPELARKHQAGR